MTTNVTLFGQIIGKLDRPSFKRIVEAKETDKYEKGINSWTHLVSMLFCQFSKSNSLREISNGLRSATGNLNHLGIEKSPCKSSLSYQNIHRDWTLFQDYYFSLMGKLSAEADFKQVKFKIKSKIYLMDSTTISLCLSIFDWAKYRKKKGAIKIHTVLDYDGCLPAYICMTDGKKHDVQVAKNLIFPSGSVVVSDRAYIDFKMLYEWLLSGVTFVNRLKKSIKYKVLEERDLPIGKYEHIISDHIIELSEEKSFNNYPKRMRLVTVWDEKNNECIEILTNNFSWTANTISELYKSRWQIEIFFKEVKQLLKIKSFVGTSPNAVMIQIWTAMITMLILRFLKRIARYDWCLSNLVAFLRLNLFVKIDLQRWLDRPFEEDPVPISNAVQLRLVFK